jgi:DNA-binding transcriptional MerR regulator
MTKSGTTTRLYQVREFAELAGVTVRALHHYDRLGLLKPRLRSEAGYRLYSEHDLLRLEQIVVLKFLGLPLRSIGKLLNTRESVPETLRRQQAVLFEKHRELEKAIEAIGATRQALTRSSEPDWTLITQIIRRIAMQNDADWTSKYYSESAKAKVDARKKMWSPELQERVTREWNELFRDVEAALGEDPTGPKAQALAARWRKLVAEFTGGDPGIQKGLNAMYADQSNWPPERKQYQVKPEIQDFIMKAMRAGSGG